MSKSLLLLFFRKEDLSFFCPIGAASLAICAFLAACAADPPKPCAMAHATSLPLQIGSGHFFTDVILNGEPVRMIVDTGANVTVVSQVIGRPCTRCSLVYPKLLPVTPLF